MAECTNFLAYKLQILHIGGCKGSQNSAKQHAYLKRSKSAQFSISSKSHSAKGPYADIATENSAWYKLADYRAAFQHVLEHGKPHERSTIIKKLAGKIVQMSQQKFASNIVEKCLAFGDPNERQLLVDEMLC
ncbi:hypothetical protein FXO38_31820, partial [Capsicum annuum]